MDCVFECASTFAQLVTVFNAASRSCEGYLNGEADSYFEREFVCQVERGMQPEWPVLNPFLKVARLTGGGCRTVLEEYISDAVLDQALNCLVNRFLRMRISYVGGDLRYSSQYFRETGVLAFPKMFLNRGASLYHKNGDERLSSIAAIAKLVEIGQELMAYSELRPYMCCHMINQPDVSGFVSPWEVRLCFCISTLGSEPRPPNTSGSYEFQRERNDAKMTAPINNGVGSRTPPLEWRRFRALPVSLLKPKTL